MDGTDGTAGVGLTGSGVTAPPHPDQVQLLPLARALGGALTADEVAGAVFDHAMSRLGASTAGLWMVEEDALIRFAGGAGLPGSGGPHDVGPIPLHSDLPAAVAVRTGHLVSFGSEAERNERWPALAGLSAGAQAVAVVPLVARGRPIGALHVGWSHPTEPFEPDTELLWGVADLSATALDRAYLYEGERSARETLELLNQGTRLMISADDPELIVQSLVQLAVPGLAPWCAMYVAQGDQLVRVAVEISSDPALAEELRGGAPVPVSADVPLAGVYRSGTPLVVDDIPVESVRRIYPPAQARKVLALIGPRWSELVVPVRAAGEVIGVMSLLSPDWAGPPPRNVRYAADGLAARAGVALRNAERYREQVDNIRVLTAALLPESVPDIAGLRLAARYVPASGGVCGDWYEAEALDDTQVLIGIGDASGHGLVASATMARLRHAARGLAVAGIRPGRMLDHLSRLLTADRGDAIATSVYGIVDRTTGDGHWANAGHPPPIVVHPDGSVACAVLPPGPPIGAAGDSHRDVPLHVPIGGRVILYTDGLFERRGESPATGIQRLVDRIGADPGAPEDAMADAVMAGREDIDDACVLIIGR